MQNIGKILPIEGYKVSIDYDLPIDYTISLTHLYQPLIGMEAITLYQTLLHESILQKDSIPQTHHSLMNYINLPLDAIYEARLKLEGIGLLETYKKNKAGEKNKKVYYYRLKPPLSPRAFFKDPMLSELLSHHVSHEKVKHLEKNFKEEKFKEEAQNITASFSDVFQTFQPSSTNVKNIEDFKDHENEPNYYIDFQWMETMLNRRMVPVKRVLTPNNKKLISDMKHLYQLTTNEIEKSLLWSLTEENYLDEEEFKNACHDLFKTKNHQKPIKLMLKTDEREKGKSSRPQTKEEKLIQHLETISPKQLLEELSSGGHASAQDMRLIREIMTTQGLPSPVMNVLIHYVLLQSNMQLSKAYLETIASHWSRAGLKNAEEAMKFARKQVQKFHQKKKERKSSYHHQSSKEVIPDWFYNKDRQAKPTGEEKQVLQEEQKTDLHDLIEEFSNE